MRRIVIAAVVLGGFWIYNNGYLDGILGSVAPDYVSTSGDQGDGDPVVSFAEDDSAMGAAMSEARTTLPLFLSKVIDSSGQSDGDVSLKVAFDTSDGGAEIIWVGPFTWDGDDGFTGRLANQPNFMGDLNQGDKVSFTMDMIRDWAVVNDSGTLFGHYTTRVMIPQLDEGTQAALNAILSPTPVPADWSI